MFFYDVADHLTGNFDESCFMANQDGSIKFLASRRNNKTKNNCDDYHASVPSLIGGNCFGNQGLFHFSIKRKHIWVKKCRELESNKRMPPHSHVAPSTKAYMANEIYLGLVPKLCKGIREILFVRYQKDWWCI